MTPCPSIRIARLVRANIFLIVAVLCVVPAMVRAGAELLGSKPAPIRLSRGFELPPTKAQPTRPADAAPTPSALEPPMLEQAPRRLVSGDEALPESVFDRSPNALRGPPSVRHA